MPNSIWHSLSFDISLSLSISLYLSVFFHIISCQHANILVKMLYYQVSNVIRTHTHTHNAYIFFKFAAYIFLSFAVIRIASFSFRISHLNHIFQIIGYIEVKWNIILCKYSKDYFSDIITEKYSGGIQRILWRFRIDSMKKNTIGRET